MKIKSPKTIGMLAAALMAFGIGAMPVSAAQYFTNIYSAHLQAPIQGGLPLQPVLYPYKAVAGSVSLKWFGFPTTNSPFTVQVSTNGSSGPWITITNTLAKSLVVPSTGMPVEFYQVIQSNPPTFAGAQTCLTCHSYDPHVAAFTNTPHATAFSRIAGMSTTARKSCVPCHSVGNGFATGYKDDGSTPQLANVQCESCHGPSAAHAANPADLTIRPVKETAGELCGGCHTGSHHPTYEEYSSTLHGGMFVDMAPYFAVANPTAATNLTATLNRMNSCGWCHSGDFRLQAQTGETNIVDVMSTATLGVTCVTCHDPHGSSFTAQLRNPTKSTNFYSVTTAYVATNTLAGNFATKYNPSVQVCGQCHNDRGLTWNSAGRPPHHSVQYPILVGQLGTNLIDGITTWSGINLKATHGSMSNQCAGCHMQTSEASGAIKADTGHTWSLESTVTGAMKTESCVKCHRADEAWMELLVEFSQDYTKDLMNEVKTNLNLWVTQKATNITALLASAATANKWTNGAYVVVTNGAGTPTTNVYLPLVWEFGTAGQLATNNLPTNVMRTASGPVYAGPSTYVQTNAALGFSTNIMQARTYLYLVEHDGSYGVHNPVFTEYLLKLAIEKVKVELNKP